MTKPVIDQAFILGAGMGTRLRPLTLLLPKPLVPVFHRPMAAHAFEACAAIGISRFAVNTHHLAAAWNGFQPPAGTRVEFFHEPVLLDTGGGLKNIEPWIGGKPALVHNGDILTRMPLDELVRAHHESDALATLAVRRHGPPPHLALDATGSRVADIRRMLDRADGTHGFTGVYCIAPEFLALIPPGRIASVIPAFLECIRRGRLGAAVIEDGLWLDLGDRDSYLRAHRDLALDAKIHPEAVIHPSAEVSRSVVGPGASVKAGARLDGCVVWPGASVRAGAQLSNCIIATTACGKHREADFTGESGS